MSSFDPMAAAVDWLDAYRAPPFRSLICMPRMLLECGLQWTRDVIGRAPYRILAATV